VILSSGALNLVSLALSFLLLVGLVLWFFVNRASSRTMSKIELPENHCSISKSARMRCCVGCVRQEPEKEEEANQN
jgi:hypothetical protein